MQGYEYIWSASGSLAKLYEFNRRVSRTYCRYICILALTILKMATRVAETSRGHFIIKLHSWNQTPFVGLFNKSCSSNSCTEHATYQTPKHISEFYVYGSVHRWSTLITVQRDAAQKSIYYSASSLYMFRVSTTPIIRNTQSCNYSLRYWSYFLCGYLPPTWPT